MTHFTYKPKRGLWSLNVKRNRAYPTSMPAPRPGYENGIPLSNVVRACAGCLAAGAAAMYFLDPERGTRRRNVVRGKVTHTVCHGRDAAATTLRYTRGRIKGVFAAAKALFADDYATDKKICDRVRSALGRAVSHSHALTVEVERGVVMLRGPILAPETDHLIRAVRRVRGVRDVVDRMDRYVDSTAVPSLQGGIAHAGRRGAARQECWDPATRLLGATAGAGMGLWGVMHRGWSGGAAVALGVGLMARSLTNLSGRRLIGIGAGPRAVDIQKTINIHAPIGLVFAFFSDPTNFPHFMANVRDVRDTGGGRLHWIVSGPLGIGMEWNAQIIDWVPRDRIAWRSIAGSMVKNAGVMKFQENSDGGTRVDIKFSYNPPGGALGHMIAKALRTDPKREMDSDLARVKTLLETGHRPRDAARPIALGRMAEGPQADAPQLQKLEGLFVVQCGECGLLLEPMESMPEDACPRCRAYAWQRFELPILPMDEPL